MPSFDSDKAATKIRKTNRLQKAKAAPHLVLKLARLEREEDLMAYLEYAKTEARRELDSINKKDVDAYVAGMR